MDVWGGHLITPHIDWVITNGLDKKLQNHVGTDTEVIKTQLQLNLTSLIMFFFAFGLDYQFFSHIVVVGSNMVALLWGRDFSRTAKG